MMDSPAAVFAATVAADPARPLITYYDDRSGERTELSAATCANWVAKTANLLVDGVGAEPGDVAGVLLPAHWQTAAVVLGCWSAGLAVAGSRPPEPTPVVFAAADRLAEAAGWASDETYGLALAPLAGPLTTVLPTVPAGVADYVVEVRAYGDQFTPPLPVDPDGPALWGAPEGPRSHRDVVARAVARARELGFTAKDRVLVVSEHFPENLTENTSGNATEDITEGTAETVAADAAIDWLMVPLTVGASVVLCREPDPRLLASRVDSERVTVTWGVDVPGYRRAA